LTGATVFAVEARGVRLEMTATHVQGAGPGVGLDLASVSGFIRSSDVGQFGTGLRVGDGGCPRYSDLTIGGSLEFANDLGGAVLLELAQPESVNAELNFWGSTVCQAVLSQIVGQGVNLITNDTHQVVIQCGTTASLPTTWGSLKERYAAGGRRPR
jgi:hypothetical protein